MKIKEICEKTGLTDRTVRYYIEEGLISPFYTENYLGRKSFDFSDADLERLKAIATLRSFSFTVEEIKELFSKGVAGTEIVETVKKRTQANLDDSQRCLSVLSGLDLSREADILTLAQTLYDSDAAIRNETVMPNPKKRILSFAKSCALFLVVWLPVLVAVGVMIVKFCTLRAPVVRPAFFVATLLCFLPSLLTALIFKKSKKTRRILPALLMSLCVLALPAGAILSSQSVMVCHHSYEAYHTVREASCSREGERVLKCKDCGDLRTQAIKRLPHTEQILAPRAPTCALEGLGEGKICSLCGEITMPQAVIPKTDDHTTVIDAAVAATCKSTGLTEGSHCSVCNKVLVAQTVIPKTDDHTPVTDAAVAATCKSTGLTEGSHCSVCNKVLVAQTVIPKTDDHTIVTDAAVPATCTQEGLTAGSHCAVCKKVLVKQTTLKKRDHVYDRKKTTSEYLRTKATTSVPATYYYSCQCGSVGTTYFSYGTPLTTIPGWTWCNKTVYGIAQSYFYTKPNSASICGKSKVGYAIEVVSTNGEWYEVSASNLYTNCVAYIKCSDVTDDASVATFVKIPEEYAVEVYIEDQFKERYLYNDISGSSASRVGRISSSGHITVVSVNKAKTWVAVYYYGTDKEGRFYDASQLYYCSLKEIAIIGLPNGWP